MYNQETVLNSINEVCDLEFVRYNKISQGHDYFYLNEQSSLQILRVLPINTHIFVSDIFSQRHRIAVKINAIKMAKTIAELFHIVLPLVENGSFPCDIFTLVLNKETKLESHNDGEVHLSSGNAAFLHNMLVKVFANQQYDSKLLLEVINQPNIYHKLERPNKIIASYETFDELTDAI